MQGYLKLFNNLKICILIWQHSILLDTYLLRLFILLEKKLTTRSTKWSSFSNSLKSIMRLLITKSWCLTSSKEVEQVSFKRKKWIDDDNLCHHNILNSLANQLYGKKILSWKLYILLRKLVRRSLKFAITWNLKWEMTKQFLSKVKSYRKLQTQSLLLGWSWMRTFM